MCARRFLMLIFILTLLVVGGAFAIFEFGGSILTRAATPVGHYQEPPKAGAPDYSKDESWIAKPGLAADPSGWLPQGFAAGTEPRIAAVFYVHPTTYLERDKWNAPLDPGGQAESRAGLFVQSQASAFNGVGEIWAPRYRQAAFGAFLLDGKDARQALDLAYGDVRAAFDRFLAAQPPGKPVILAGHSQGSLHLLRLLRDRKAALRGRLVAAYVAGWPVGISADLPATGLQACSSARQKGCVLSWQSFGEPANARLVTDAWVGTTGLTGAARRAEDMLCVNPIGGTANGVEAPTAAAGALEANGDLTQATIWPGAVGAECRDGFLIASGSLPPLGQYVLPGNNYHVYDYALFWGAIRADAERRAR